MTVYIKDLIQLPEKVHGGDFVLKLTEGVRDDRAAATLRDYVVTPQLRECFDAALDFIRSAINSNSSKAAYLHGSFGAGKSHFMAVLHLLLQRNAAARAKEGLESVVTKSESWLAGKKFLLVPYHMIGQSSMEAAILGGYVERVMELHPDAPLPAVFRAEGLFRDAASLRERLGDAKFFEGLNERRPAGGSGWGALEAPWDPSSYEVAARVGALERSRLIGDLIETYFASYRDVARQGAESYVDLDSGLEAISQHARSLGYDALVLFLDELILWLATHAADQAFLNREGPKVSKLVEAEHADRPIPIISFIARQRDLRELVGSSTMGAEELNFADILQWWEARFDKITLEDRNLPEIAARRVLLPRSEAARQQLDAAWKETERFRNEILEILLTPRADREVFRKVYPFSPALVETLVAVSSALQRERTALKVMLQLLVSQRDTLELGQIVPVGDLFHIVAQGDEAFTEGLSRHFENAKRLYHQKLAPMIEKEHGLTREDALVLPAADPKRRALVADDRILTTLLLAALLPELEVLRGLTPQRLVALNHGSFRAPIPGREAQAVLSKCRNWAAQIGEIKIGDDSTNPTITLQLSGVDTEGILDAVKAEDNDGNRRRKIRDLLFVELGVAVADQLFVEHEIVWRGTRHRVEIIYTNVCDATDATLATRGNQRKIIIDFPFDPDGRTPRDDLARLETFQRQGTARTLAWLPSFFSRSAQRDLGTLVKLDYVLSGDRLDQHATHLSAIDRQSARELLKNQQSQLRQRILGYLRGAYGVEIPVAGSVDDSLELSEHAVSLTPSFTPQPPVGASLAQAFEHLLGQMLGSEYPGHPQFDVEIKTSVLRKVHEVVERAASERSGRVAVDQPLRPLMNHVAVPLRLGEMGETHFVLGQHWRSLFQRALEGQRDVSVGKLREAIDQPLPMGLSTEAENLLILTFAAQTNRSFFLHGGPFDPKLDKLPDELELREQPLPDETTWRAATDRAGKIFGISVPDLCSATNVSALVAHLREAADSCVEDLAVVQQRLLGAATQAQMPLEPVPPRVRTASALRRVVEALRANEGLASIEALAHAEIATSADAMGTAFRKADSARRALEQLRWDLFEPMAGVTGEKATEAVGVLDGLREALGQDEYAVGLAAKLAELDRRAVQVLAYRPPSPAPPPSPPPPGVELVGEKSLSSVSCDEALAALRELGSLLDTERTATVDLSWRVARPKKGQG